MLVHGEEASGICCVTSAHESPVDSQGKKLFVNLQGNRKVSGTLRGYDIFLNLVLDDAVDETKAADQKQIGTMVR